MNFHKYLDRIKKKSIIIINKDKEQEIKIMVTFTNIPKHMDKQIYMKSLSKEYKMPLDMIFCLMRDLNSEEEFYKILEWNKSKNGFGWKK